MNDPANPVRLNEKWIVIILWISLLGLLYLTTSNGAIVGFGGNVRDFYAAYFSNGMFPGNEITINQVVYVTAAISIAMALVLAILLFDAWTKFISLTNQLLIAFVQSTISGESNPILFELLDFPLIQEENNLSKDIETDEEVFDTKPDEAIGSMIGSVLKAIALSWLVIILAPHVIVLVSLIFH